MQKNVYQAVPALHFAETLTKYHAKKRLLCLIVGNFGAYNFGDEAILAGTLTELAKIPHLKIAVAAENATEAKRLHGSVRTVPNRSIRREIKKSDFVVVAGGGLFKLKYIPVLSLLLWKQRIFKKKIYIFGLHLSDKTPFLVKVFAYPLIRAATLVSARDQATAEQLKRNNIHVHVFQDPSGFMEPAPITAVQQDVYFKRFYKKSRLNIGLALRKPASKNDEKKLLTELTAVIAKLHTEADFWFYATDHHPKYFNDEKFGHVLHETIKKKVGRDVQFHFIPTIWNPQTYFASIKLMTFVISMCPYVSYFGTQYNSNIVNIKNTTKQPDFMTMLGIDTLKMTDVTSKKLLLRIHN